MQWLRSAGGDGLKLATLIERFAAVLSRRGVGVTRVSSTPWLKGFLVHVPARLPRSYEYFLRHYRFSPFCLSGVDFYSNLGDDGTSDLVVAAMADRALHSVCFANLMVPIGRPAEGSYDPICFDLREGGREAPLVRVDHEEVLVHDRVTVTGRISESILQLIQDVVDV
jgi:hypothetical protein